MRWDVMMMLNMGWMDRQSMELKILHLINNVFLYVCEERKEILNCSYVQRWEFSEEVPRKMEGSWNPFIFISIRLSSLECYPLGTISSTFHALHALYGDVFNRVPWVKWMMQVSKNNKGVKVFQIYYILKFPGTLSVCIEIY